MIHARDFSLKRRVASLGFLLLGYFFYAWSWNTVDILRPYIKESLGLSDLQAGSAYTLQSIGAVLGAVVIGQLADKFGRRNALIVSMIGYGSFLLGGLWVDTYAALIAQRIGQGFFMGSMFPIAVGIYSGLFERRIRGVIAGIVLGTYNVAVSALGFLSAAAFAAGYDWRLLLMAGAIPAALALAALLIIPDDRLFVPMDGRAREETLAKSRFPISELFQSGVRRQTILLALMSGLNFFAYQAFTGWASTYLRDERKVPDAILGDILGWQFIGAALGGLAWGVLSDRHGRRGAAWGFVIAAAIIPVYLFAPMPLAMLQATGFLYGAMISSSSIWGPWLSELYPAHLRATAASIFNWGRVVSMTAPLLTGYLARSLGLAPVMCGASVSFLAAALIWLSLPETVARDQRRPAA